MPRLVEQGEARLAKVEIDNMQLLDTLAYELPPGGISLLGYIARRMHKTGMLAGVPALIKAGQTAQALRWIAEYTLAASTSFGRAHYQPSFDREGEEITEADPATGAVVTARLQTTRPRFTIECKASMPDGGSFRVREVISGTTIGFRGLGMPAPSEFEYTSGDYSGRLVGIITSELVLSLIGATRIRAYGSLRISDSAGNLGSASVERNGAVKIVLETGSNASEAD